MVLNERFGSPLQTIYDIVNSGQDAVHLVSNKSQPTIFWDVEDVLLIDYLPVAVTGQYHSDVLDRLRIAVTANAIKCVLLRHANARMHTCQRCVDAVKRNLASNALLTTSGS